MTKRDKGAPIEIDVATSALVLLDLQNVTLAMSTAPHTPQRVLRNAMRLAEACRRAGMLVVLVRVSVGVGGAAQLHCAIDNPFPEFPVPERWDEFPPNLLTPKDVVVTKFNWGAFYATDLDLQLRRRGIHTVLLGGIATNFAVESTARQAHEAAYEVVLIEDAMTAFTADEHRFAIERIFPRLGRVRSTDEILAALAEGDQNCSVG